MSAPTHQLTKLEQAVVDVIREEGTDGVFEAAGALSARRRLAEIILERGHSSSMDSVSTTISALKRQGILSYPNTKQILLHVNGSTPDDSDVVVDVADDGLPQDTPPPRRPGEPAAQPEALAMDHGYKAEPTAEVEGVDVTALAEVVLSKVMKIITEHEQREARHARELAAAKEAPGAVEALSGELDTVRGRVKALERDLRVATRERDEATQELTRARRDHGLANEEVVRLREQLDRFGGARTYALDDKQMDKLREFARTMVQPPGTDRE